jgi:hypothetical protein
VAVPLFFAALARLREALRPVEFDDLVDPLDLFWDVWLWFVLALFVLDFVWAIWLTSMSVYVNPYPPICGVIVLTASGSAQKLVLTLTVSRSGPDATKRPPPRTNQGYRYWLAAQ